MTLKEIYLQKAIPLSKVNIKHPWLAVLPPDPLVRLVRLYDIEEEISDMVDLRIYFNTSPISFMYPMFFFGTLFGFGFRSIEGKEFTVKPFYPMLAYTPTLTMKSLENCNHSMDLVMVEGVSDAEAVSAYYPWVMAVMGNKVKNLMQELLPFYVQSVYLLLDNDAAGKSGTQQSLRALAKKKIRTHVIAYPSGCKFKDPAKIVEEGHGEILQQMLKGLK